MNNFIYVNPIDTLDTLLKVKEENKYTDISYFKLWIKTVLEQRDGDFATLDEISTRLSSKFKKSEGNGNRNNTIDEYVFAAVLRYICKRESLKWNGAFKALEDMYGYLEYCNKIDSTYVLYLVGRLFYDIQEYYEDYVHIRREFTNNINDNTSSPTFEGKFDYINKERVEHCIKALLPNIDYKVPEKFVTVKDILDIAELFFDNAYKQKTKEHYAAWLALTKQKKGIYYFYHAAMLPVNHKEETKEDIYENAKDEFSKAISQYERTIEIANKNINNLLFNIGICYFYQEMMAILFEGKSVLHAYDNCQKAVKFLSRAISAKDESEVKSEYTFRRNPLDVYYYRLLAIFEFIRNYSGNSGAIGIQVFDDNKLYDTLKEFNSLLEENNCFETYGRVEYYITMAKIKEYLNEKEFVVNDDISTEPYWEKAKLTDEIKFDYPYRIGLAFNDKKYTKQWAEELKKIKYKLKVDTLSNKDYEYYQNPEIKNHFQKG